VISVCCEIKESCFLFGFYCSIFLVVGKFRKTVKICGHEIRPPDTNSEPCEIRTAISHPIKVSPVVRSVSRVTVATQWPDRRSAGPCVCIPQPLRLPWWVKSLNLEETTSRVPPWGLQIHTPSNMKRNVPSIVIYLPRCGHSLLFSLYHALSTTGCGPFLPRPRPPGKDGASDGATSQYRQPAGTSKLNAVLIPLRTTTDYSPHNFSYN